MNVILCVTILQLVLATLCQNLNHKRGVSVKQNFAKSCRKPSSYHFTSLNLPWSTNYFKLKCKFLCKVHICKILGMTSFLSGLGSKFTSQPCNDVTNWNEAFGISLNVYIQQAPRVNNCHSLHCNWTVYWVYGGCSSILIDMYRSECLKWKSGMGYVIVTSYLIPAPNHPLSMREWKEDPTPRGSYNGKYR